MHNVFKFILSLNTLVGPLVNVSKLQLGFFQTMAGWFNNSLEILYFLRLIIYYSALVTKIIL